ncbi:MAG: RluA family pseudouridine synthase [Chlamydiales bacterium]
MEFEVEDHEEGSTLVNYLKEKLKGIYSSKQLKRYIEQNHCLVNGVVERFASTRLQARDQVVIHLENDETSGFEFENDRILFEDDAVFVYDKPSGVTSDAHGILQLLSQYVSPLFLVHRLDKETSGVIILAKNPKVKQSLELQFKKRLVSKKYLCLVQGVPSKKKGTIKNFIGKITENRWKVVDRSKGKYAETDWEVLTSDQGITLMACYPKTGRTHQIRLHMLSLGLPILGDYSYFRDFTNAMPVKRCLLHAQEVSFNHPTSQGPIRLKAPIPQDFIAISSMRIKSYLQSLMI